MVYGCGGSFDNSKCETAASDKLATASETLTDDGGSVLKE
jgi:hypothetical protein